jgi:hypothetical protein
VKDSSHCVCCLVCCVGRGGEGWLLNERAIE